MSSTRRARWRASGRRGGGERRRSSAPRHDAPRSDGDGPGGGVVTLAPMSSPLPPHSPRPALHLRGVVLDGTVEGEHVGELWVTAEGRISLDPVPDAETVADGEWILPGLVDAHCHVGIGPDGPVELEIAREQGHTDAASGALLLRDCGSPVDTRPLDDDPRMPEIVRAGRHLARPKRYIRGLPIEADAPEDLPGLVAEQARANPWVKLVGDWIERE